MKSSPSSIASANSPSVMLPMRFMLAGILSVTVGMIWLAFRPDVLATYHYNQYVVSLTHLFTLGWISTIIMGAMYQLVPVALETRLFSERLARWQFSLHVIGFAGMVAMFWIWDLKQVGHFGSVLGLGVFLFAYNIGRTLARIPRWNVVAAAIAAATFWLTMTIIAGLLLSAAKCWEFSPFSPLAQMHAHAHLGGLGFFIMMLVGVSYKLVPMFVLGEVQSWRRAGLSVVLLNLGMIGVFITVLWELSWKPVFAWLTVGGLALYGWEMTAILRARKRRPLDWGLIYFLSGISLLIPVSALGLVLSWPGLPVTALTTQLENVYGFLALGGVLTLAILGMLYKIVPFLVWYARYSELIGRGKVPALADLYSARIQAVSFWFFLSGLAVTTMAITLGHLQCVQRGCALLATGVLLFAVNMAKILSHLFRPKSEPLGLRPAFQGNL